MTTMRSEVGKIKLDALFQSRSELNESTAMALENSVAGWGIHCERYEVLKIEPPYEIKKSMQYEAEAERLKRKDIILSEALKISEINKAEGKKQANILKAEGEADAINVKAQKEKEGLQYLNEQINNTEGGEVSMNYILRHRYLDEYRKILEHSNVTVLPDSGPEGKDGKGGSSDILGVVAMMMNGGNMGSGGSHGQGMPAQPKVVTGIEAGKPGEGRDGRTDFSSIGQVGDNENTPDLGSLIKDTTFYEDPSLYAANDGQRGGSRIRRGSSMRF